MLPKLSRTKVIDSSGAGWIQTFHVYRGFKNRYAGLGDFVKGAIKVIAFYPRYRRGKRYRPLRLGYVVRGLVVQTRYVARFTDNTRLVFLQNATVLLKRRGLLKSKFITGPLVRTIRRKQYHSIFSSFI